MRSGCGAVVDPSVEAEVVDNVAQFCVASGDADDATPADFGELPGQGTHGPACARHHDGFTGLRVAYLKHCEIGRDAGKSENAEVGRDRRDLRVDLGDPLGILLPGGAAVLDCIGLPAQHAFD